MRKEIAELIYNAESNDLSCPYINYQSALALADYLIKNDFVKLPYSPGDTLYYIDKKTGELDTDTVKFITITKTGSKPILERHNRRFWEDYQFGIDVFTSKAAAEQSRRPEDCNL